jgi:hypothetical protein
MRRESLLRFLYVMFAGIGPEKRASRTITPCGESPDYRSLTLRIKLSMNPVYQLMLGKTDAAKHFRRARQAVDDPSTLTNAVLQV